MSAGSNPSYAEYIFCDFFAKQTVTVVEYNVFPEGRLVSAALALRLRQSVHVNNYTDIQDETVLVMVSVQN